jgi:hypothetical protein
MPQVPDHGPADGEIGSAGASCMQLADRPGLGFVEDLSAPGLVAPVRNWSVLTWHRAFVLNYLVVCGELLQRYILKPIVSIIVWCIANAIYRVPKVVDWLMVEGNEMSHLYLPVSLREVRLR